LKDGREKRPGVAHGKNRALSADPRQHCSQPQGVDGSGVGYEIIRPHAENDVQATWRLGAHGHRRGIHDRSIQRGAKRTTKTPPQCL